MVFLLVACNTLVPAATDVTKGTKNAPSPAEQTSSTSELGTLDWMSNTPANPIDLSVDLDTDRAVEAIISSDGGKLEATGADGTYYLLDLPASSVVMDTLIRMTPVKTVSDLPLKETATTWAVQLEPEGLQLLANASLTIQFPTPPPVIQQIPFQYQGTGRVLTWRPQSSMRQWTPAWTPKVSSWILLTSVGMVWQKGILPNWNPFGSAWVDRSKIG
ncbi:MAG: hypothetical protein QM730_15940 [Anaerolineales bacterium]